MHNSCSSPPTSDSEREWFCCEGHQTICTYIQFDWGFRRRGQNQFSCCPNIRRIACISILSAFINSPISWLVYGVAISGHSNASYRIHPATIMALIHLPNSPNLLSVECLCYMTKVIFQIIPAHDSYLHSTQLGNIAQHLEAYQQFSLFLHPTFLPFTTSIIPFTAIIPSKAARFFVWAATSLTRPLTGTQYTLSCS